MNKIFKCLIRFLIEVIVMTVLKKSRCSCPSDALLCIDKKADNTRDQTLCVIGSASVRLAL